MAQRIVVTLLDDLTGAEVDAANGESVSFGLDGRQYAIDLTSQNASELRAMLKKYIDAASPAGVNHRFRVANATKTTTVGPSSGELRAWARSNGFEVSDRGRVPSSVRAAYDAAH